ncbi:hypothetical protein D3C78_905820 [compost metagenome]
MAAVAVARIDEGDAQLALPAEQLLLQRGLEAVDAGLGDVLRDEVLIVGDRVLDIGAIQRGL